VQRENKLELFGIYINYYSIIVAIKYSEDPVQHDIFRYGKCYIVNSRNFSRSDLPEDGKFLYKAKRHLILKKTRHQEHQEILLSQFTFLVYSFRKSCLLWSKVVFFESVSTDGNSLFLTGERDLSLSKFVMNFCCDENIKAPRSEEGEDHEN